MEWDSVSKFLIPSLHASYECVKYCICETCLILQDLAYALEDNIKRDMVDAINERCQCDFTEDLIDMGEMSCHYSRYTAVYRYT